jgi:hypothetical protein
VNTISVDAKQGGTRRNGVQSARYLGTLSSSRSAVTDTHDKPFSAMDAWRCRQTLKLHEKVECAIKPAHGIVHRQKSREASGSG